MPARSLVIAGFNGSNDFQRTVSKVGEISRAHPELLNAPIIINLPSESEYFRWLDTDLLRPKSTEREKNYRACPFVYDSLNKKFYGGADDTIDELEDMVKVVEMHTMKTTEDQSRQGDSGVKTGHNQQQVGSGINTGNNKQFDSGMNTGSDQQLGQQGLNTRNNQQQDLGLGHTQQQQRDSGLITRNNQQQDLGFGHTQQQQQQRDTGDNQQQQDLGLGLGHTQQQRDSGDNQQQQDLGLGLGHTQQQRDSGSNQQRDQGLKTGSNQQQQQDPKLGSNQQQQQDPKLGFNQQQQQQQDPKLGFTQQQQDVKHGMKTTGTTHTDASGFSRTQT